MIEWKNYSKKRMTMYNYTIHAFTRILKIDYGIKNKKA